MISEVKPDQALLAARLAALAHPVRLSILRWLSAHEVCNCKDVVKSLPLAQSTVSQHLKVLAEAGLVQFERTRPVSRYRLNRQALAELAGEMNDLARECCAPGGCSPTTKEVMPDGKR